MDWMTFILYILMYIYGFSLMIWAIFFDKHPSKKTLYAATIGLIGLICTLIYFVYVLYFYGLK